MTKFALALAGLIAAAPLAQAQEKPAGDLWAPIRFLVGEWQGAVNGEQGKGTLMRRYRFILSSEYFQEWTRASFPPQPLYPDGSVLNYSSFMAKDSTRKTLVFRDLNQEHLQGVFVLSATQGGPGKAVFESERLDNVPVTWKAREIFEQVSPDEYTETFEVAEGDKPFTVRSRIQFKRRQP